MLSAPFRSGVPSVSMRPVRVTMPAPITTPMIPSNGLLERSAGIAPEMRSAICRFIGKGRTPVEDAMADSSILRPDADDNGKARAQAARFVGVVKGNLHRHPLNN